jgi:hypothetical protein
MHAGMAALGVGHPSAPAFFQGHTYQSCRVAMFYDATMPIKKNSGRPVL